MIRVAGLTVYDLIQEKEDRQVMALVMSAPWQTCVQHILTFAAFAQELAGPYASKCKSKVTSRIPEECSAYPDVASCCFRCARTSKELVNHSLPPPGPPDAGHGNADVWYFGGENACQELFLQEEVS